MKEKKRKMPRGLKKRMRSYRPHANRGCSSKQAFKAQAQVEVILQRQVYILGIGAPKAYQCSRCGYWHHGRSPWVRPRAVASC